MIMGLVVATKAFFKLMFDRELSESFEQLVAGKELTGSRRNPLPQRPLNLLSSTQTISQRSH